jgi:hypothetical protein
LALASVIAAPAAAAALSLSFDSAWLGDAGSVFFAVFPLRATESLCAADFEDFVSVAGVGATRGVCIGDAVNVGGGVAAGVFAICRVCPAGAGGSAGVAAGSGGVGLSWL